MSIIDTLLAEEAKLDAGRAWNFDRINEIKANIDTYTLSDKQRSFANAIIARAFTAPEQGSPAQLRKMINSVFNQSNRAVRRTLAQAVLEHPLADTLTERQVECMERFAH